MQEQYAQTLVEHAVSLRPGQDLFICGPQHLHDFALLVGEAAYEADAKSVQYRFPNIEELDQLIRFGSIEQIRMYHETIGDFYAEIIKRGAASLALIRDSVPLTWSERVKEECPESFQFFIRGMERINCRFHEYISQRRFPHATVPVAVESWAQRVFPESDDALRALWDVVTHACGDVEERWHLLSERQAILNRLEIREIHITGGGNDTCILNYPTMHDGQMRGLRQGMGSGFARIFRRMRSLRFLIAVWWKIWRSIFIHL